MTNKIILITGASSGIGKACFDFLSQKGFTVYGTSRKADGQHPYLLKMDVCDTEEVSTCINYIIEKEGRIDVLINNAGISIVGSTEFTSKQEIENIFNTNFWGIVHLNNCVLPHMRKQKAGIIINVSSLMGLFAIPFQAYYTATKHALEGYTEALRMEIKPFGIKATLIEPGDFRTDIGDNRLVVEDHQKSPYQDGLQKSLAIIEKGERMGANPEKIAKLMFKIIKKGNPKIRYTIGKPLDVAAATLKKVLPQKVFEWLIMDHYNLN